MAVDPDCGVLKYLFSSLVVPSGEDNEGVPILSIFPVNLPDPLQISYDELRRYELRESLNFRHFIWVRELERALLNYEQINFVWVSCEMKFRPSFETVDLFVSKLDPSILLKLKKFIMLGQCTWLDLVTVWLRENYPSAGVELFRSKFEIASNLEEFRQALPNFKLHDIKRIQYRIFGEPLELVENGQLPSAIVFLMDWIKEKGLNVDGIFRLSADSTKLEWLKSLINAGRPFDTSKTDPLEVACLLKLYFRDLPSPIVSRTLYPALLQSDDLDEDETIRILQTEIFPNLSEQSYTLLMKLMEMLHRVALNDKINRMNAKNLAICWAPNLIYDEKARDQFRLLKASLNSVEIMIRQYPTVFSK